ncbi:ABATE domain-containing protein [Pseudomonas sp. NPDC007930]|uniref:CGNR zinc finger domain-containing protein n=1 Tax=Pseudomonas sp. NPDC007930 TaxID=3364417 RepID=UPI0036E599FF
MHDHPADFFFIADHPTLDLLNTQVQVDGQLQDEWRSAADVLHWCARAGISLALPEAYDRWQLLEQARALREAVRELVLARQANAPADLTLFNGFLRHAASYGQLQWHAGGIAEQRQPVHQGITAALAPLVTTAAQLLREERFERVRQCQHPDCILWFYDHSKAQRRRWCSMALCGNRHKVAEHRKRQKAE